MAPAAPVADPPESAMAPSPAPEELEPAAPASSKQELLEPTTPSPVDTRNNQTIQKVITDNRDGVRQCYEQALATNPGIEGDLVVAFVIRPDGTVKQAEINWGESDIHIPELDNCAVKVVSDLTFPASSRGLESRVNYPYNFRPGR